jgi:diguanylate cyclase (GGDEF)-like protein
MDSAVQALRLGAYDYLVKSNLQLPELQNVIDRALERRRLARSNRELLEHLRQTQEELERRRAAELSQVRRIGEALAAPLTWEQLFNGLASLIWESLPLEVLGIEAEGPGEPRLEAYRRQPQVKEAAFQKLQEWVKWQFRVWQEGTNSQIRKPILKTPFPATLWEKVRVGEVVAVVAACRDQAFSAEEAELFRIFVLQGEAALKNLVLFEKVKSLAIRDALTGLYNYGYFTEVLRYEVEKARRYKTSLTLLFLDIDDFKQINDTYGHTQGDRIMRRVGNFLRMNVRQADLVCRYGGDEFALLLTQTTPSQAMILAQRLCRGLAETPMDAISNNFRITVSIGVAGLEPGMSGEDLVKVADAAHYRAKQAGKNQVCLPPPMENPGPQKAEQAVK